jgi:hypothetical protein
LIRRAEETAPMHFRFPPPRETASLPPGLPLSLPKSLHFLHEDRTCTLAEHRGLFRRSYRLLSHHGEGVCNWRARIGPRGTISPSSNLPSLFFLPLTSPHRSRATMVLPTVRAAGLRAPRLSRSLATPASNIGATKVAMSKLDPNSYINYQRIEDNLAVVRSRSVYSPPFLDPSPSRAALPRAFPSSSSYRGYFSPPSRATGLTSSPLPPPSSLQQSQPPSHPLREGPLRPLGQPS